MVKLRVWCALAMLLAASALMAAPAVVPLLRAHAHNDYRHAHPLWDAVHNGFCSVEADIFDVDGALLVAHERADVQAGRTLQSLYLDPMRRLIRSHHGRLYPGGPTVTLLIEIKDDPAVTWPVLDKVLHAYSDVLTSYRNNVADRGAIDVVITGHEPRPQLFNEEVRYAGLDGSFQDLDANPPATQVPWISENWPAHFTWTGDGPMPDADRTLLARVVARTHAQGRRLRFWGAPDVPAFWGAMLDAQVDLINTDHLPDLRQFLLSRPDGTSLP